MENTIHKMITERDAGAGKSQHLPNPLRPVLAPVRLSDMGLPMETKKCTKCGEIKSFDLFKKRKSSKDGLDSWCKECSNKNNINWKKQNMNMVLEYNRNWNKKHRYRFQILSASYRKKFPEKIKARSLFRTMVLNGMIKPKPCEVCGCKKVEGHHDDYSKPLEVRWLCTLHHRKLHAKTKDGGKL